MTNTFSKDTFKHLDRLYVGFDDKFANMVQDINDLFTKNVSNYPPYNIKKTGENSYSIEIAVAGFGKQDIDIELEGDKLTIHGVAKEDNTNYLFKGIANRNFTRHFTLADTVEVKDAELLNGMLKIWLERIIPDNKKAKKIHVKEQKSHPTLLTEEDDI